MDRSQWGIIGPISVYVHFPFCPSKCGYCDFNSYAMTGPIVERTIAAMAREIRSSPWHGIPAKTIFFGGGTPTFVEADQFQRVFDAVADAHPPVAHAEITSEANPGTVDASKFTALRQMGVNRVSIGAQSFRDDDLVRLERVHASGDIERAVAAAREAGFENLNLDLMFALPGQTRMRWQDNLERAIALSPEHLSLYGLTLEPNTSFYKQHLRGQLIQPEEDEQIAMYEMSVATCAANGYGQYEISNFAKPGCECRHNLAYWLGEPYAGYGPGAVGCMDGRNASRMDRSLGDVRTTNLKHPERYCAAVESGAGLTCEVDVLTPESKRLEAIMLGLRLNIGFSTCGLDLDPAKVERLEARGWIERAESQLRLTPSGRHVCSEVALELI